jgi:hypothetical protein
MPWFGVAGLCKHVIGHIKAGERLPPVRVRLMINSVGLDPLERKLYGNIKSHYYPPQCEGL